MTSDMQSLLREAADALWLIPIHGGLAHRLTNAAEDFGEPVRQVQMLHPDGRVDVLQVTEVSVPDNGGFVVVVTPPTQHAAERTRPSEAEVRMLVADAEIRAEHIEHGYALSEDDERDVACLLRALVASVAALSTPPLPSAEPVACEIAFDAPCTCGKHDDTEEPNV